MSAEPSVEIEREIFMRSLMLAPPPDGLIREFTRLVKDVEFPAGATLFRDGAPSGELYFVVRGKVELSAPDVPRWVLDDGSVVGVFDALQARPHARTATAMTDVKALAIDSSAYFEMLEDDFDFARAMVSAVSEDTWQKAVDVDPQSQFGPLSPRSREAGVAARLDNMVDRILLLYDTEPFCHMPTQALVLLGLQARAVAYPAGHKMPPPGESRAALWVVASGRVRLSRSRLQAEFGPHTLFAGFGSLTGPSVGFGMEVVEDAVLLAVMFEDLFDVMEEHFAVLKGFMRYTSMARENIMNLAARAMDEIGRSPG